MAKNYEKGDKYYLPVVVDEIVYGDKYPVKLTFLDGGGGDSVGITDEPNLLLTADEIIDANIIQAQDNDKARYEEIKKRYERALNDVGEMGSKIKELKTHADELETENEGLYKRNEELSAKVGELVRTSRTSEKRIDDYMEEKRRYIMNIRLLLDKIAELEGEKNG